MESLNRCIFSYDNLFFSAYLFRVGALLLELCVRGGVFSLGWLGSSGWTIKVYMNFGCVLLRSPL